MAFSPRRIDRIMSLLVYSVFAGLALWAGIKLINHSLNTRFYEDFLVGWETAIRTYNAQGRVWPRFTGSNHAAYMENLVRRMRGQDASPPPSNTRKRFVYRLDRLGDAEEDIFFLCFPDKMVLYGMSFKTFSSLDKRIDGRSDEQRGHFRGWKSKDGFSYIGQVLL
ncbi:MAG: hypothetical protein DRG82_13065 [Deltaproteobacteria bacterium]|nr:MAG: hypothetical protein DRG82_13065 [Deltaproteobacteria bacterium]